ncbi:hypothetical protein HMPREF9436_02392 [Faecalibacterium cf. prausnitzii KLE1255]|uniref:Uncharacterized protein n=1 Tax=Faecalibacterium cf. prausnitzii KLE1255 TaxID=748224 RepID=E2ZL39_9FIRM|nr:hypothetical protein HMPREF9436_02392 [Faecalibacterium cf. prausnitzii KLE1255]
MYCAVQRHAACDDKISAHAKSPRSAKDTSCYAARRLFVYFVCGCVICLSGHLWLHRQRMLSFYGRERPVLCLPAGH